MYAAVLEVVHEHHTALLSGQRIDGSPQGFNAFRGICSDRIMTLPDALPHIPTIHVDADMARRVRQGYRPVRGDLVIPSKCQPDHDGWLKMVWESQLVALAAMERSSKEKVPHLKLLRVFHEARECH